MPNPALMQSARAPQVFRATGAGALSETLQLHAGWRILETRLHLSGAGGHAENFTITVDSAAGAAYDSLLYSQDTNGISDLFDVTAHYIARTDVLNFAWANAGTLTWGLEVFYEVLP